jgi:hypothetical protein
MELESVEPFNPKNLSLPAARALHGLKGQKPPRHKPGEKFLKGPIPWKWLMLAAQQPGRAFHVAIALWFLAGIKQERTVGLSNKLMKDFGVDRHAKYRGLHALEVVGLVSVERRGGRSPVVTILDEGTCLTRKTEGKG